MRILHIQAAALAFLIAMPVLAQAPTALTLSGDYPMTHDPSIAREGGNYYVFATGAAPGGGQFPIRCSTNLTDWKYCGKVFDDIPEWIRQASPKTRELWAPDISFFSGKFHLYYAYSAFGVNTSGIALATNETLDSTSPKYRWNDEGLVLKSTAADDFNAIDPNIVFDENGSSVAEFRQLLERHQDAPHRCGYREDRSRQTTPLTLSPLERSPKTLSPPSLACPPTGRPSKRHSLCATSTTSICLFHSICVAGEHTALIAQWLAVPHHVTGPYRMPTANRCVRAAERSCWARTTAGLGRGANRFCKGRRATSSCFTPTMRSPVNQLFRFRH